MRIATVNIKTISAGKTRFEGKHFLNTNSYLSMALETNANKCSRLEDIADVFNPPVFKRQFCVKGQNAVNYLQSSDILSASEYTNIYINRIQATSLNLLVKKDDILVTGFGTIGDTRLVSKYQDGVSYANNVCRIRVKENVLYGYVYAFMASKYGCAQLNKNASGSVVRYIEAPGIKKTLIPNFSEEFTNVVDLLIKDAIKLREDATEDLEKAEQLLKEKAKLHELSSDEYDYFGHRANNRTISCFSRNIQDIGTTTINAFNHSERIRQLKKSMTCQTIPLKNVLKDGRTYGTSGLPNIEVKPGHGIMLINQKDMFDNIVKGKWISSKGSDPENVLEYGEILIACDGTLGENELFCRAVFANEDLKGSYVSSHFLRLKVNETLPAGYLYCWLNSDYGFRLIRNTQAGTKLCHPINKLFLEIPVPVIDDESTKQIDLLVRQAHTKRHQANQKELKAIQMVEKEIESWSS